MNKIVIYIIIILFSVIIFSSGFYEGFKYPKPNYYNMKDFCISQGHKNLCSFGKEQFQCSEEESCFRFNGTKENKFYLYDYHFNKIGETG